MKKIHSFDAVFDGQKMFRLILKAYSNPLQRMNIKDYSEKLYGSNKNFLALAFTLLDNETTFYSFENQILDDSIHSLTLSRKGDLEHADFIFVENEKNLKKAIQTAKCGTLADPHKSAVIIVKTEASEEAKLTMYGPGIDGTVTLHTDPLAELAVRIRDGMFFEYPQGLDFLFVDQSGGLFAIPRLVKKEEK